MKNYEYLSSSVFTLSYISPNVSPFVHNRRVHMITIIPETIVHEQPDVQLPRHLT